MVRALWLTGFLALLARAQQELTSVVFNTDPQVIDDLDTTLSVVPSVLSPQSLLLNASHIDKRQSISVVVAGVTTGGTAVIAGNSAVDLYNNIAAKIKAKSDQNSCTLTYGTDSDDGYYEGYAYQATTTGKNCDTTAIMKTIQNAVKACATKLHNAGAIRGCCQLRHGQGTWHGHLRLTANPSIYPATSVTC